MRIGLTGSIACGKSTVSHYLNALGYPVVDADAISRSLTAPGGPALPAICEAFGSAVFRADGTLNRRALSDTVFGDAAQLARLNAVLHPMILAEISRALEACGAQSSIVFADVPLLYECGMQAQFDRIWVVYAHRETQIARLAQRDGLNPIEAAQRIDAQMPLEEKIRQADAVISTECSIEQTQEQIRRLLDVISKGEHYD